jgi:hypothetical protein
MLDKTIDTTLLYLRRSIIRDGKEGLAHVEALLLLRGINPSEHHVPRKFAQRRDTSRIALEALKDGPKRGEDVSRYAVTVTDLTYEKARGRMYQALHNLRRRGLVVKDGKWWDLAEKLR